MRLDNRWNVGSIRKCGIWGCGQIGTTLAFTLMQTGWFSDIVLIDPDFALAEAEATDLAHTIPFHTPMDIYAGDYADLADCGLILLTAASGEEELPDSAFQIEKRLRILKTVVGNIALYNRDAIILNICDPVELLTLAIQRFSGFPVGRVLGSGTVLDTARLKQMVGRHLGVDSRNVHSFIVGEHGETEFPIWSSANVSGIDLHRYCDGSGKGFDRAVLDGLFRDVRDSRAQILQAKGVGYFAVAESVKRIVSAIVRDENTILTVSAYLDGHYGLDDIYLSLPCIVNRSGIRRVLEIPLNEEEESRLRRAATVLKKRLEEIEASVFV